MFNCMGFVVKRKVGKKEKSIVLRKMETFSVEEELENLFSIFPSEFCLDGNRASFLFEINDDAAISVVTHFFLPPEYPYMPCQVEIQTNYGEKYKYDKNSRESPPKKACENFTEFLSFYFQRPLYRPSGRAIHSIEYGCTKLCRKTISI